MREMGWSSRQKWHAKPSMADDAYMAWPQRWNPAVEICRFQDTVGNGVLSGRKEGIALSSHSLFGTSVAQDR
jgi:hypothetical protein